MKKIGFLQPSSSGHAIRGVGFYAKELLSSLLEIAPSHHLDIIPFQDKAPDDLDLIHYTYFDFFKNTLPLRKSTKTIVSILDVIPLEYPQHYPAGIRGNVNLWLQKKSLENVNHVITISEYSKNKISQLLKIKKDMITVTPLSAAPPIFKKITDNKYLSQIKRKYLLPEKFVLYVGDVNWNKNLLGLTQGCLKAELPLVMVGKNALNMEQTLERHNIGPKDILRKISGKPHPELESIKLWLDEYSNNNNIQRLGFVPDDDLVGIYNLASVYCQASFVEGFGLPVLQALFTGTPVAASNTSSIPEIGADAIIYFDPNDPNTIASALHKIASDDNLRKTLSRKGTERAKVFSWKSTAALTTEVYLKTL